MLYINNQPNEIGNYGNPSSNYTEGKVALSESYLNDYISAKGFVNVTIKDGIVTAVEINQEAYDDYEASLPEPEPQPDPMTQDEIESMLLDQEYRLLLLEYGLEEEEPI